MKSAFFATSARDGPNMPKANATGSVLSLQLHERLLAGDDDALGHVWSLLWRPLCRRLSRRYPHANADAVSDAVTDAIRIYAAKPEIFDAGRALPDVYVFGIARRILRDSLRSDGRRQIRERAAEVVLYGHRGRGADDVLSQVAKTEVRSALLLICTPSEFLAFEAYLEGAGEAAVAVHLGLEHLQRDEQRRAEKRLKDALTKRLKRFLRKTQVGI